MPCHAFEAGSAKVDITPEIAVPLAGDTARLGRDALGVHDPLYVRCLYLDDGLTSIYLLSADLYSIPQELYDRVLEQTGLTRDSLIITATHTPNGPGGLSTRFFDKLFSGRHVPEFQATLTAKFAEAVETARAASERASIGYDWTTKQTTLTTNRRSTKETHDTLLGVIRVDDADGNIIAVLTNMAAQPSPAPQDGLYHFSAGFPGAYCDALEALAGPKCVALFLNGACADQAPGLDPERSGWAASKAFGQRLAAQAYKLAEKITCDKAVLQVSYAMPELPPTLGKTFLPSTAMLQTLEINDLLLTFFPGIPYGETALVLRQRARDRGYRIQFSVAPANNYIHAFAPASQYNRVDLASSLSFYGPAMEDWLYDQFETLMTKGEPTHPLSNVPATKAEVREIPGGFHAVLTGSPYEIGRQRGEAFATQIRAAYERKVKARLTPGALVPDMPLWNRAPSFFNQADFAVLRLAIGSRPMMSRITPNLLTEIDGMAAGAGLPFDALWMLQCTPTYAAHQNMETFYQSPFCTVFAAVGDRAGADDLLVGRNLDWPDSEETNIVFDVRPETGHRFIQVGFPWNSGVFTGMNDAGVVVCAERMERLGEPRTNGVPIELVLRNVMQNSSNILEAIATLKDVVGMHGYHVFVASAQEPAARVVEYAERTRIRKLKQEFSGLLLGADPRSPSVDGDAQLRYARVAVQLMDERIVAPSEIEAVLIDQDPDRTGTERIFNSQTLHCVVFEPKNLKLHVAFPDADGQPGPFTTISMNEDDS